MSRFILVHGASHGGWCWFKVKSALEQMGHSVLCPDLPSHGTDRTNLADVSLSRYAESIVTLLSAESTPVILVGHSLGGAVISEVANLQPNSVSALVFVAAFLLENKQTIHDIVAADTESKLRTGFELDSDLTVATPKLEAVESVFYNDCPIELIELAKSLLVPHSLKPNDECLTVKANANGIPHNYIECTLDQALTLPAQRKMQSNTVCDHVFTLESGHSPFFSVPDTLASHLDVASQQNAR